MHRPAPLNRRSDLLDEPAFLHHVLRRPSASGLGLQAMAEEVESLKLRLWVSLAAIGEFSDSAYAVLSLSSPVVIPRLHLASAAVRFGVRSEAPDAFCLSGPATGEPGS